MTFDADVLVIGAGPVGMTLANELARHGAKARIIDKAPAIREVSKAMILHVRTQEILDRVGAAEAARREGAPLREVAVHAYGKAIGSWELDEIDSPYKHPLILGQNRTQHILADLLASRGVSIGWNREATSFEMDAEGVTTTIQSADGKPETVRTRYIVGCEGSNSLVRRTLKFSFEGERYSGEQFIQADCRIKWALPKGRSYLFLTAAGYLMVIEFPNGVVRVFISLPDENAEGERQAAAQLGAAESATEIPTLEEVQTELARLSGYPCELSDAIWLARYRTSHRFANRFSQGRAFICGDAGHVHVPIGGQGMNTGIQDAFNLGWKLAGVANGDLEPSVLESYDEERRPVAESLIRGTDFAYKGILHPSEARQAATRLFGPFLVRSERVQDFVRSTLEEFKIAYPGSSLNLDLGGASGPKPGERALDAIVVKDADKATVTLNDLTRTTTWTVLIFSGVHRFAGEAAERAALAADIRAAFGERIAIYGVEADKSAPHGDALAGATLLDPLHEAHQRYGVSNAAFYLLRPDTYVGARGPLRQGARLIEHLKAIFA